MGKFPFRLIIIFTRNFIRLAVEQSFLFISTIVSQVVLQPFFTGLPTFPADYANRWQSSARLAMLMSVAKKESASLNISQPVKYQRYQL